VDAKVVCYCTTKTEPQQEGVEQVLCSDVISMDDVALRVVRKKKDFTLIRAMRDLSSGVIDALVTCAHTGALTSAAVIHLKRFTGLRRPGLLVELPLNDKNVVVLDVGAFLSSTAQDVFGFARLGGSYATLRFGCKRPRIGLLNVGKEALRGSKELIEADQLLRSQSLPCTYVGNIEPMDVFSGAVDVCVTTGMLGNVFLKTAEAVSKITESARLRHESRAALLAGMVKPVLKCHGEGSPQSIFWAVQHAVMMVQLGLIDAFHGEFVAFLK
jgi:glycerol-3-phosphate acyltransferase PlsX